MSVRDPTHDELITDVEALIFQAMAGGAWLGVFGTLGVAKMASIGPTFGISAWIYLLLAVLIGGGGIYGAFHHRGIVLEHIDK